MQQRMIEESTRRPVAVRKKPVVVKAMCWDGSPQAQNNINVWSRGKVTSGIHGGAELFVDTEEGTMTASLGDWIICGVQGEFYPCKPDIFAATYDIADGDGVYALEETEMGDFRAIQRVVHTTAVEHGWWEGLDVVALTTQQIAEIGTVKIALMHSELSEALEELREGRLALWTSEEGKPEGMSVELADAIIRIMDLCGFLGIDLLAALRVKAAYNETRSYRHGGKAV